MGWECRLSGFGTRLSIADVPGSALLGVTLRRAIILHLEHLNCSQGARALQRHQKSTFIIRGLWGLASHFVSTHVSLMLPS